MKKITTELFSTESDLSRSLDIVYTEPEGEPRRKISEKYRHSSSSSSTGSGDGAASMEKRKPSVTQLSRASPEEEEEEMAAFAEEPPIPPPRTKKKTPSPTKIKQPCAPLGRASQEQISEEVISPVLEVSLRTPENALEAIGQIQDENKMKDDDEKQSAASADLGDSK